MTEQRMLMIELPEEARELLADNGIDLITALRESGLAVRRSSEAPPVPVAEGGKEVALTIVAIGVASTLVATGIAKILDALGRNKKFVATEHVLAPVVDGDGKPLHDASGQPLLYWAERQRLVEAQQTTQDGSNISLEAGPGLLKFSVRGKG
jgi:hypothetical protein